MSVLILGHTGVLGSNLLELFKNQGTEVFGISRSEVYPKSNYETIDFSQEKSIAKLQNFLANHKQVKYIINCVGEPSPDRSQLDQERAYKLNVLTVYYISKAINLFDALFIHMSSMYVFGHSLPPYNEDSPLLPVNYYGVTKVLAENIIERSDLRSCCIRLPMIIGFKDNKNDFFQKLKSKITHTQTGSSLEITTGDEIKYPTSVKKVFEVLLYIIQNGVSGYYNLSSSYGITTIDLINSFFKLKEIKVVVEQKKIIPKAKRIKNLQIESKYDFINNIHHQKIETLLSKVNWN